jgi:hypothetical protein
LILSLSFQLIIDIDDIDFHYLIIAGIFFLSLISFFAVFTCRQPAASDYDGHFSFDIDM